MYSFPNLEPICCSMSSSNCCFLNCIQISQEAGQVVWYSHLFKNFPDSVLVHSAKGFGIVNKAEVDIFLELSWFFNNPTDVGNFISGPSAFSKSSLNIWKFTDHIMLKPGLENFELSALKYNMVLLTIVTVLYIIPPWLRWLLSGLHWYIFYIKYYFLKFEKG